MGVTVGVSVCDRVCASVGVSIGTEVEAMVARVATGVADANGICGGAVGVGRHATTETRRTASIVANRLIFHLRN